MQEIARLNKPYTDKQKSDFISEYKTSDNIIIENNEALECWIYTADDEIIPYIPPIPEPTPEEEQERINNLTMTALDFIGVLESFGLDYYTEIKPFLETHSNLDKQLKYCQNVWCGVAKQVFAIPITIGNITITSEMVEQAFKDKTGENDEN